MFWRNQFLDDRERDVSFSNCKSSHHSYLLSPNEHLRSTFMYTDVSTRVMGGVLMQGQGGTHTVRARWGLMEIELFAFVFLWRILLLTFYSLNRVITRSLYLSISTIPITGQIEGPRIGVQILIEHIPGSQNIMADRLHIETIFQYEHSISTPFNRCKLVLMGATCS
jgi:hypothetical protein